MVSSKSTWASQPWGTCGVSMLAHPLAAEVDDLAVGQRAGRAVAHVVERDVAPERAEGHLGLGARP